MSGVRVIFIDVGEPEIELLDRYDAARSDEHLHTIVLVDPNAAESRMAARMYTRTGPGYSGWRKCSQSMKTDAEDMLHDIERKDERDRGVLTPVKAATVRRMLQHGLGVEWIAEMLAVSEDDVRRIAESDQPPTP